MCARDASDGNLKRKIKICANIREFVRKIVLHEVVGDGEFGSLHDALLRHIEWATVWNFSAQEAGHGRHEVGAAHEAGTGFNDFEAIALLNRIEVETGDVETAYVLYDVSSRSSVQNLFDM